ncbi:thioredoxin [Salibacterium salarium]|uniref:Thioredoxin n=1 Tax=Salibacterium salarium TaxID=284579 RepID=A0A428N5J5_9BACI|nr:thioredoxin family protein [Salibacterium salarium]RSL33763.1 thioredoxin [Salibacterium salarium]
MNEIDSDGFKNQSQGSTAVVFFYTPLCGTCKLAQQMMEHVEKIYDGFLFYKANINQVPDVAKKEKIESVPCLKLYKNGQVMETIYAFHSIPSLLKKLHPSLKQFIKTNK